MFWVKYSLINSLESCKIQSSVHHQSARLEFSELNAQNSTKHSANILSAAILYFFLTTNKKHAHVSKISKKYITKDYCFFQLIKTDIWTCIKDCFPQFQCHNLFSSQDIKQNVLLTSYLDKWWHHKLYDLSSIIL